MLTLTQHFKDRWREYFGGPPPGPERVERICREGIWLQTCRVLYDRDGIPYKNVGMYWDPGRNIVIKVDWLLNKVVTVITPRALSAPQIAGQAARRAHGAKS